MCKHYEGLGDGGNRGETDLVAANLEMGVQVAHWGKQRTTIYYGKGLQNRTRVLWRKEVGSKLTQSTCHNCQDGKKTLENRAGRTEAKESVYMGTGWRHGSRKGEGGPEEGHRWRHQIIKGPQSQSEELGLCMESAGGHRTLRRTR